ncbi:MAG: undecaprenyl/decaprenyl-phosphate alpha-N-acetylglucosaminyl 1-phosphate transferase [Candidatus Nealsonbacteria bacterium]|nr:undecaprenyl/decaprenyl-phosphate alpha-N-acetylglucosaminyl 1-phosphate transferase [Candidatus Nealsonbacteria bacterium]
MLGSEMYLLLGAAAVLGTAATWLNRAAAVRFGFVNAPNPIIPQHTRPVAHLGGIGVAFTAAVGLAVAVLLHRQGIAFKDLDPLRVGVFLLPGLGFLVLGTVDDLKVYSPQKKFLVQLILAAGAVGLGHWALGLRYPFTGVLPLDLALSVFWIVAVVNALNLTDVCDGLVGGLSVVMLVGWAHFDPTSAPIAMAVAGGCLGFLVFNSPPASIFLGDAGSHFLGYSAAMLTLPGLPAEGNLTWVRPIQMALFVGVPIFEVVLLVIVRRRKGLAPWRGSPDHFSLRLQAAGLSKWQTDGVAYSAAVFFCTAAFLLGFLAWPGRIAVLAAAALFVGVCWKLIQRWEVAPK